MAAFLSPANVASNLGRHSCLDLSLPSSKDGCAAVRTHKDSFKKWDWRTRGLKGRGSTTRLYTCEILCCCRRWFFGPDKSVWRGSPLISTVNVSISDVQADISEHSDSSSKTPVKTKTSKAAILTQVNATARSTPVLHLWVSGEHLIYVIYVSPLFLFAFLDLPEVCKPQDEQLHWQPRISICAAGSDKKVCSPSKWYKAVDNCVSWV